MAVLHLVSDTARRGAQVFAVQLAAELEELGHPGQIRALKASDHGATLAVPVLPASWRARRSELGEYDLVIAHGSTALEAAALASPGRFVYRSIGDPTFWLSSPRRRAKVGLLLRAAKGVVALYPEAAAALHRLARVPQKRLRVVPNAVSQPTANHSNPPSLTGAVAHVLFVGALSWEKQVEHAVKAVARLDNTGLVCVGDGPEAATVSALGRGLLGDRFLAVGAVQDPQPYYQACDILALTSQTEGQPACVLEAALAGMPTCAYDVGGISEMVLDRQTGRVVAPNDINALGDALQWTIERGQDLGPRAREHVRQRYSMSTVATAWAGLITEFRRPR